jgi:hypothetical protein
MLRHSGTSAINPAFLQEIKDDSVHLRELLDATRQALSTSRVERIQARALSELFSQLRDQLATHFILEEFYGYFDDALDVAPRLTGRARDLKRQHEVLYTKISHIAEDCDRLVYGEPGTPSVSHLVDRYRTFYDELSAHEADERQLILEAFYDDVGTGD